MSRLMPKIPTQWYRDFRPLCVFIVVVGPAVDASLLTRGTIGDLFTTRGKDFTFPTEILKYQETNSW